MLSKSAARIDPEFLDRAGLVVVDHGSRREESNRSLLELVQQYRSHSPFKIVEPAHMELAEPSIPTAIQHCIEQQVSRIVVQPFFLFPGNHWYHDIPDLTRNAIRKYPGVDFVVTKPIGIHELLFDILNDRVIECLSEQGVIHS